MTTGMTFDASRLNAKPGDVLADAGTAIGSRRAAAINHVRGEMTRIQTYTQSVNSAMERSDSEISNLEKNNQKSLIRATIGGGARIAEAGAKQSRQTREAGARQANQTAETKKREDIRTQGAKDRNSIKPVKPAAGRKPAKPAKPTASPATPKPKKPTKSAPVATPAKPTGTGKPRKPKSSVPTK
jgi:hypothetical protein